MITHSQNPVKLVKYVYIKSHKSSDAKPDKQVLFVNLKTNQQLIRPVTFLEDNENGKHLNYELMRLDIEESEYQVWMKDNG